MPINHLTRESLSLEFQVMLAALQAHLKTAPEPHWHTLLARSVDWQQVLSLCQHHEVTPLVYESLKRHAEVPPETLATFKQQVLEDKKRSLHLAQVLDTLLAIFEQEGVEVLPYKGVVLSQQLFGDIAKRPTKDLDLVVQKKDYARTRDLLLTKGFTGPFTSSGKPATPQQERAFLTSGHHHVFHGQGTIVELHFEILPASGHKTFPLPELWSFLEDKPYKSYFVKMMNQEQLAFVLTSHAASHYWRRLKWLFDSAILFDQLLLTGRFLEKARVMERETLLLASARLCQVLLALPLDQGIQASLSAKPTLTKVCHNVLGQFQTWPHKDIHGLQRLQWRVWLNDSFDIVTLQTMLKFIVIKGGYTSPSLARFVDRALTPLRVTSNYISQRFRK